MKDWQLDAMYEAESERMWADQNAPDPCEDRLITSARQLSCAYTNMGDVLSWIDTAANTLKDTPMEAKVRSLLDDLEKLNDEIHSLKEMYKQGRRE